MERFAQANGFGRVCLVNLFALRSPHPRDLEVAAGVKVPLEAAIGEGNDGVLRQETEEGVVVAAWGGLARGMRLWARYHARIEAVLTLLSDRELHMCGPLSGKGYPLHGYNWGGLRGGLELLPVPHDALRPPLVRSRRIATG